MAPRRWSGWRSSRHWSCTRHWHGPRIPASRPRSSSTSIPGRRRGSRSAAASPCCCARRWTASDCGAWPSTSGSKGLQVYLPLNHPDARFEQTRAFARALAELLAREEPALVVATQAKARREGRVLIDWYQNDPSKTTIAAYSLRARPRPTVSTPVDWDEVERCASGGDPQALAFTASEVLRRVASGGDLFAAVDTLAQRLPAL